MPNTLDPLIVPLLHDDTKRTSFIVSIDTPTPRRWTPFPGGLTVAGVEYSSLAVEVAGVVEALDDAQPAAVSLTIASATRIANDLVLDAANRRKPIRIERVWFYPDWTIAGTDVWFIGVTGKPSLAGAFVTISCSRDLGRTGTSPTRSYSELLLSHRVPDGGQTVTWGS